jgi:hypothetical protein
MIIESFQTEKLKDLPVGTYSLYASKPVRDGTKLGAATVTVTLTQWLDNPPTNSKWRLSRLKFAAKFIIKKDDLMWQLALLEQVLAFANDGKCDRVFRFICMGKTISNQQDWHKLQNNCRLIREEKERGLING